jgi:hypothetical protein
MARGTKGYYYYIGLLQITQFPYYAPITMVKGQMRFKKEEEEGGIKLCEHVEP